MPKPYYRYPPIVKEDGMVVTKSEVALIAIAVALWVFVLFGSNLIS
jgi:hypothetical protein